MPLIDSHAHLTDKQFAPDLADVIHRAQEAGVVAVVAIADRIADSQRVVALAQAHPGRIHATAGVHPHSAKEWGSEALEAMSTLLGNREANRIVAVGEMGLDYHYDFSPRDAQITAFRDQLRLAREFGFPCVVHCREAADDVLRLIGEAQDGNLRGVVHCFSEDPAAARRVIDLGFHIGIGGMVTFKRADALREVIAAVGLERLLVETDAPYLAPIPHRGKRNEPAFVRLTAERVAEVLGLSFEAVAETTTKNACDLFGINMQCIL